MSFPALIGVKGFRVESHPGSNTVLGGIQFVPNDACIVDLRRGLPNEGSFGVSISIRAERPNDPVFNRELREFIQGNLLH